MGVSILFARSVLSCIRDAFEYSLFFTVLCDILWYDAGVCVLFYDMMVMMAER